MDNRQGDAAPRLLRISRWHAAAQFFPLGVFACACVLIAGGCASPGEPTERKPPVPQAVADLAAEQVGNSVSLTFTVPQETVDRRPVDQPLAVEIFRDFQPASASSTGRNTANAPPIPAPTTLLATIPSAMASNYVMQGRFHYTDEIRSEDFSQHPNSVAVYAVRTRASAKKESSASNAASVRIYPLPDPIDDLKAEVTHSGIELSWTPPTKTPVGSAPQVVAYHIHRAATQPTAATQTTNPQAAGTAPAVALRKIGEAQSPSFLDPQIQFGNTYIYSVRSVVQIDGRQVESGDSNQPTVLARAIFPPAAPQGLVVVYVPVQGGEPVHVELSWSISPETDLAGYNVYRSEQPGLQGTRLNPDLLLTPAFRDMNTAPGRAYFYTVTAVDRSGNESPASATVSGGVPAENPSAP
jgi:hypothetical protein